MELPATPLTPEAHANDASAIPDHSFQYLEERELTRYSDEIILNTTRYSTYSMFAPQFASTPTHQQMEIEELDF